MTAERDHGTQRLLYSNKSLRCYIFADRPCQTFHGNNFRGTRIPVCKLNFHGWGQIHENYVPRKVATTCYYTQDKLSLFYSAALIFTSFVFTLNVT